MDGFKIPKTPTWVQIIVLFLIISGLLSIVILVAKGIIWIINHVQII